MDSLDGHTVHQESSFGGTPPPWGVLDDIIKVQPLMTYSPNKMESDLSVMNIVLTRWNQI